jgi:hypothetical protein
LIAAGVCMGVRDPNHKWLTIKFMSCFVGIWIGYTSNNPTTLFNLLTIYLNMNKTCVVGEKKMVTLGILFIVLICAVALLFAGGCMVKLCPYFLPDERPFLLDELRVMTMHCRGQVYV